MPRKKTARKPVPVPALPEMAASPVSDPIAAADPVVFHRWGWYLLALLVPLGGIFAGLFLYDAADDSARRVGRNCLLISFVLWVILPIIVAVSVLLLGFFTVVSWLAQVAPAY